MDSTVACSLMPSVEAMTVDALSGLLSGSPDHAGVARDNQGGRRPAEYEQDPAAHGEPLPWPAGGVEIAAGPGVGLDHRKAEVNSEADLLDCRARRTWAGGGSGVGGNVLGGTAAGVAGPEAKAGAGDEDDQQADQGSPGLVAVADDQPLDPRPEEDTDTTRIASPVRSLSVPFLTTRSASVRVLGSSQGEAPSGTDPSGGVEANARVLQ